MLIPLARILLKPKIVSDKVDTDDRCSKKKKKKDYKLKNSSWLGHLSKEKYLLQDPIIAFFKRMFPMLSDIK